ncbi:MAG TPA: YciI family protein [Micromonosporaceae bacterium]
MEITDEYMRERLARSREYTVMLLYAGPNSQPPDRDRLVWEHGRRNFALRAQGLMNIVCPVNDGSPFHGVAIFDASLDEARRIMDDDPGVRAGLFRYELHPTLGFPGDRLAGA